jgi:DNA polymerase III subunit delta'
MIIGHQHHIGLLNAMQEGDSFAHAFLLSGPRGVGKREFARDVARWLQCEQTCPLGNAARGCSCASCAADIAQHPDIVVSEGALSIAGVRAIRERTARSPFLGRRVVVIIQDAERMRTEGANALLKALEEPRGDTVFLLITERPSAMLPTIHSRCYHMKFHYVPNILIERALKTKTIAALKPYWSGRPARAAQLLDDRSYRKQIETYTKECGAFLRGTLYNRFKIIEKYARQDRMQLGEVLEVWIAYVRAHVSGAAQYRLLRHLSRIYKIVQSSNASVELLLNSFAVTTPRVRA